MSDPTAFKLMIFIDGQNLMYGCRDYTRESGFPTPYHYDETKIASVLSGLRPRNCDQEKRRLVETRFYASKAQVDLSRPGDEARFKRQGGFEKYLQNSLKWCVFSKEVKAYPISCPYHKDEELTCPSTQKIIRVPKNKGVDVALATDLVVYGLSAAPTFGYDIAIVVSGDSDFVRAIQIIRQRRPEARIEVAQFRKRIGEDLRNAATWTYDLDGEIAEKIRKQ